MPSALQASSNWPIPRSVRTRRTPDAARVNGEERQSFPTSDMVHGVEALIEHISSIITLHPRDMIATGTSVGCGIVERPPRLLNDGDVVDCEIVGYPGCRNAIRIPAQRAKKH